MLSTPRFPMVRAALASALVLSGQKVHSVNAQIGDPQPTDQKGPNGEALQSFSIVAPTMTEEDQYGYNMPEMYKCDACRIIGFHLNETMLAKNPKEKGSDKKYKKLKSWEYVDIFDSAVCQMDTFDGYGLKVLKEVNHLSGRALAEEHDKLIEGAGSISMGSDSWKKRLAEECRKMIYDKVGEEETYHGWYKGKMFKTKAQIWDTCIEHRYCTAEDRDPQKKIKDSKKSDKEKKKEQELNAAEANAKKKVDREKSACKKEKKEKKQLKETVKKLSLEGYIKKVSKNLNKEEDLFTKPRTEAEWGAALTEFVKLKDTGVKLGDEEL